ncbi:MAG: hypothetical protein KAR42_04225 [candidate division Zixibacteria bacterium]|nr:hypothetical protein [candidate division Zixibacteria bacterium]
MGQKLVEYYKIVSDHSGIRGKSTLAGITKIPSIKAALEPDSPELIKTFEEAVKKIIGKPVEESLLETKKVKVRK